MSGSRAGGTSICQFLVHRPGLDRADLVADRIVAEIEPAEPHRRIAVVDRILQRRDPRRQVARLGRCGREREGGGSGFAPAFGRGLEPRVVLRRGTRRPASARGPTASAHRVRSGQPGSLFGSFSPRPSARFWARPSAAAQPKSAVAGGSSTGGVSAGRGNDTVFTRPGVRSRLPAAALLARARHQQIALERAVDGREIEPRPVQLHRHAGVELDRSGDRRIDGRCWRGGASGGSGIRVPIGCGKLKVAAWMVPNGDAIMWARARCDTSGWRAINATRS